MTNISQPASINPFSSYQRLEISSSVEESVPQTTTQEEPDGDQVVLSAEGQRAFEQSAQANGANGIPPTPDPEPPGT